MTRKRLIEIARNINDWKEQGETGPWDDIDELIDAVGMFRDTLGRILKMRPIENEAWMENCPVFDEVEKSLKG